jgi:hypothetical protein
MVVEVGFFGYDPRLLQKQAVQRVVEGPLELFYFLFSAI